MLDELDERGWELFSRAMIEISRTNREEVVGLLSLPKGARTALDVGGSGTGGSSQLSKATTSFMALNLLHQAGGRTCTAAEVDTFAREAGFRG